MSFSLNVEWKEVSSCHCSSGLQWLYMVYTPTVDEMCAFPALFLSLDPAVCKKLTQYYAQGTRQSWGKDAGKMHGKQREKLRLWVGLGYKIGNLAWSLCQRLLNVFRPGRPEPLRLRPGTSESNQWSWSLKQLAQWCRNWWNLKKRINESEKKLQHQQDCTNFLGSGSGEQSQRRYLEQIQSLEDNWIPSETRKKYNPASRKGKWD